MRTSLREIQQIEDYLFGKENNTLVFQAKMIVNPMLKVHVNLQKRLYALVKLYGRKQLRSELENIHRNLFSNPEKAMFQERVYRIFNYKENI